MKNKFNALEAKNLVRIHTESNEAELEKKFDELIEKIKMCAMLGLHETSVTGMLKECFAQALWIQGFMIKDLACPRGGYQTIISWKL